MVIIAGVVIVGECTGRFDGVAACSRERWQRPASGAPLG